MKGYPTPEQIPYILYLRHARLGGPSSGLEVALKKLHSALDRFTPAKQVKPEQNYFGGPPIAALYSRAK